MQLRRLTPLLILLIGAMFVWQMALIEAPIVAEYWLNPAPEFTEFMADSLYEGESFGGSDIGVTLALLSLFAWMIARKWPARMPLVSQTDLKFIWLSGLMTALVTVHSLKLLISRARPKVVLSPDLSFETLSAMTWPGFMPLTGPRGLDWNSFPSGHTASCAIMLSFAYVMWTRNRVLSLALAAMIGSLCVSMGVARSMAGMHWLSDSIASFFLTWAVIHLMADRMGILDENGITTPAD